MEPPSFDKTNTLLCRDTPPSHKIVNLTKKEQNVELIFIVLSKQPAIKTKKDIIVQCLIADETASIFINFFNETGLTVEEGDILYASGVYLSIYKDMLLLYQGSMSIIRRLGKHFFRFNMDRNMSLESLESSKPENEANTSGRKY